MKGHQRNLPCICGSGKKWKKCHPDKDESWIPPIEKLTEDEMKARNDKVLNWITEGKKKMEAQQQYGLANNNPEV